MHVCVLQAGRVPAHVWRSEANLRCQWNKAHHGQMLQAGWPGSFWGCSCLYPLSCHWSTRFTDTQWGLTLHRLWGSILKSSHCLASGFTHWAISIAWGDSLEIFLKSSYAYTNVPWSYLPWLPPSTPPGFPSTSSSQLHVFLSCLFIWPTESN